MMDRIDDEVGTQALDTVTLELSREDFDEVRLAVDIARDYWIRSRDQVQLDGGSAEHMDALRNRVIRLRHIRDEMSRMKAAR